ncbi:MAG: hypothetical protein ACK4OE_23375 [Acidovorax sp.]|uniref:hypothetical protein n=1 Tax=Acidovorax sp. TaxID=1872122 RepID=UPI003919B023
MTDKLTHHHLVAEEINDEHGRALLLTQQDGIEEPHSVLVHPWQLRAVCQQFGIIASDQQAAKTIATLQRRMQGLRARIDAITDWMTQHSDHRHADLTYEVTQLQALQDLASEWCAEFEETEQPLDKPSGFSMGNPQATHEEKSEKPTAGQLAFHV